MTTSPSRPRRPLRPLLPGPWKTLSEADACTLLARLSAAEIAAGGVPSACAVHIRALRAMPLAALPGWLLLEAEGALGARAEAAIGFLCGPGERLLLPRSGGAWVAEALATVPGLDCLNGNPVELFRLRLGLDAAGEMYRRAIESPADIDWLPGVPVRRRAEVAGQLTGIRVVPAPQRTLAIEAAVVAGGRLHRGRFRLHPRGRLDVESLEPLPSPDAARPAEARIERQRGGIRFTGAPPRGWHP